MSEANMMRHPGWSARRSVALTGVAVAGLLLSGCSSVGVHPGSAAVVGDGSLTLSRIDDTSVKLCTAFEPQLSSSQNSQVPMGLIRQFVALSLSQRLLGEQLAAQYDVGPSHQYAQQVDQIKQQFETVSPELQQAVVDVEAGDPYLQTVQVSVGEKLLAAAGQPTGPVEAALQRGQVATQDYAQTHTIRIDPVLGISVDAGKFTLSHDQTSYPVSALASQGAASSEAAPDATYTAQLTPSRICG